MASKTESVEVIEVTWKIPNFLHYANNASCSDDLSKKFSIGGRVVSADPQLVSTFQNTFHIKLREYSSPKWFLGFEFFYRSALRGKVLELKLVSGRNTFRDLNLVEIEPMDFRYDPIRWIELFDLADTESDLGKDDGSLTIYFKMEFTYGIPKPNGGSTVARDVGELLHDFEALLKDPRNADVEIQVSMGRGQTFHCHKLILAAHSKVFREMFENDLREGVVEVDDILPKTMEHFLSFVYCGRFQDSSWIQSLPQLSYAADKYCVGPLKKVCDFHLMECVTSRNALALGKLAERHGLMNAAKKIREFLASNAKVVTLDSEVDYRDDNFQILYSIPDSSTKTATETETQNDEETT